MGNSPSSSPTIEYSNEEALRAYFTGDGKNTVGAALDVNIPLGERAEALARLQTELDRKFNIHTLASAEVKAHIGNRGVEAISRLQFDLNSTSLVHRGESFQMRVPINDQFNVNAGAGIDRYPLQIQSATGEIKPFTGEAKYISAGVGYQPTPNLQFDVRGRRDFRNFPPNMGTGHSVMGGMTYRF